MKTIHALCIGLVTTTVLLSGCASPYNRPADNQSYSRPSNNQSYSRPYGVVDSIEVVRAQDTGMAGTIIGGVVGGVLGNQVGKGKGNTAATIAGAAGGAVVGHEVQKRNQTNDSYQVRVRLSNNQYQTVTQDDVSDLQVGSRVYIENDHVYRN